MATEPVTMVVTGSPFFGPPLLRLVPGLCGTEAALAPLRETLGARPMRLFHRSTHFWLRSESTPEERRTPLVPADAELLVAEGVRVTVERSAQRIFNDREYEKVGCELVPSGSWPWAPAETIILGFERLPSNDAPLLHTHVFSSRSLATSRATAAESFFDRLRAGGGRFFDLEALRGEAGRALVSTAYWDGLTGAALTVWAWARQRRNEEHVLPALIPQVSAEALLAGVEAELKASGADPKVLVVGGHGRAGSGVQEVASRLGLWTTFWNAAETRGGGPFAEMLGFDVVLHVARTAAGAAPWIEKGMLLLPERQLALLGEFAADAEAPVRRFPFFERSASFDCPVERIIDGERPFDVVALDRPAALLPRECSDTFSSALAPHLLDFGAEQSPLWRRAQKSTVSALLLSDEVPSLAVST